jgi:hypothetical protein
MEKIPTAEAIATKWALDDGDLLHDAAIEAMKEFAKLHVEASKKTIAKNYDRIRSSMCPEEEIFKSYPLENIK